MQRRINHRAKMLNCFGKAQVIKNFLFCFGFKWNRAHFMLRLKSDLLRNTRRLKVSIEEIQKPLSQRKVNVTTAERNQSSHFNFVWISVQIGVRHNLHGWKAFKMGWKTPTDIPIVFESSVVLVGRRKEGKVLSTGKHGDRGELLFWKCPRSGVCLSEFIGFLHSDTKSFLFGITPDEIFRFSLNFIVG